MASDFPTVSQSAGSRDQTRTQFPEPPANIISTICVQVRPQIEVRGFA